MRLLCALLLVGLSAHVAAQDPVFTSARGPFSGGTVGVVLNDGRLLGTSGQQLYVSADRGDTWEPVTAAPPLFGVQRLPTGDLLGSGPSGYARSGDGGASWHPVTIPAGNLTIAPDGSPWYVFTSSGALHRSNDEGANWTLVTSNVGGTGSVRAVIAVADEALVITRGANFVNLFRSVDGGTTWTQPTMPSTGLAWEILRLRRANDGLLYALSFARDGFSWIDYRAAGLLHSSDHGLSWVAISTESVSDVYVTRGGQRFIGQVEGLAGAPGTFRAAGPYGVLEASDGTLYVNSGGFYVQGPESSSYWTGTGAYRWDVGRGVWRQIGIRPAPVRTLERDGGGRLLAGYATAEDFSFSYGAVLRVEAGAWTAAGLNRGGAQDLLTLDDGRTLVADPQIGLTTLGDAEGGGPCAGCRAWAVAETAAGTLLATHDYQFMSQGTIIRSEDGNAWEQVYQGMVFRTLSAAPDGPVYAGASPHAFGDDEGVSVSLDDGVTWQALAPPDERALALFARPGGEVYMGTPAGVYRTADGGATWSPDGLGGDSVTVFAASAAGMLAGTPEGLFLRGPSGWRAYGQGLDGRAVYAIRAEPSGTGERLIVGTDQGVYASEPLVTTPGETPASGVVARLALGAVQPNPVRGVARVSIELPEASHVRLVVLDVLGRELATVLDGPLGAGRHTVPFAGTLPTGTYLLRLTAGGVSASRTVSIVR